MQSNEQAAAICHSKYRQSKKLAGCYDSPEDCINDQIRLGKAKEDAEEIADYFSGKIKELSKNNLIIIKPEMSLNVLPDNQLIFYKSLMSIWICKKEKYLQYIPEYTLEELRQIQQKVSEESEKRGIK